MKFPTANLLNIRIATNLKSIFLSSCHRVLRETLYNLKSALIFVETKSNESFLNVLLT